jgi:hypothetical protein
MTEGFAAKDPIDDARHLAVINRYNYLAHTIREMEYNIHCASATRPSYHITVKMTGTRNCSSVAFFYKRGCTIFLPCECADMEDEDIRLIMAHELGHISYDIDNLESKTGFNVSPPDDEEYYAWIFAHSLLDAKSNGYKNGVGKDEYIYHFDDLDKLLMSNVKRQQPDHKELHDRVRKFLLDRKRQ